MVQGIATESKVVVEPLIQQCAAAMEKMANYHLPAALDRRLLWLAENQDSLIASERDEMLALIEFSEERTIEKLQAKVLLKQLAGAWPHLFGSLP